MKSVVQVSYMHKFFFFVFLGMEAVKMCIELLSQPLAGKGRGIPVAGRVDKKGCGQSQEVSFKRRDTVLLTAPWQVVFNRQHESG